MTMKKQFTKREWVQLIITLSLFQAFFWYVVFENGQSGSALAYVSFAGTLVSIILAVLAIGYTYGESISSKNKSDGLAEQIDTLGGLIKNIELEASSLERIHDISTELSGFIGSYRLDKQASEVSLKEIQDRIKLFTKPIENQRQDEISKPFIGPLSEIEKLTAYRTPLDEACYLMLVYIEIKQTDTGLHGMQEILREILSDTPMGLNPDFFHGAIYTQSSLLLNLNILSLTGSRISLDNKFKDFILNSMIDNSVNEKGQYSSFLNKVHKIIKDSL